MLVKSFSHEQHWIQLQRPSVCHYLPNIGRFTFRNPNFSICPLDQFEYRHVRGGRQRRTALDRGQGARSTSLARLHTTDSEAEHNGVLDFDHFGFSGYADSHVLWAFKRHESLT